MKQPPESLETELGGTPQVSMVQLPRCMMSMLQETGPYVALNIYLIRDLGTDVNGQVTKPHRLDPKNQTKAAEEEAADTRGVLKLAQPQLCG